MLYLKISRFILMLLALGWLGMLDRPAHAEPRSARDVVEAQRTASAALAAGERARESAILDAREAARRLARRDAEVDASQAALRRRTAMLSSRRRQLRRARRRERSAQQSLGYATHLARRSVEQHEAESNQFEDLVTELYTSGGDLRAAEAMIAAATSAMSLTDFLTRLDTLGFSAQSQDSVVQIFLQGTRQRDRERATAESVLGKRVQQTGHAESARGIAARRLRQQQRMQRRLLRLRARDRRTLRAQERAVAARRDELELLRVAAASARAGFRWRAGWIGPHGLAWPIDGEPTSGFGMRRHPVLGTTHLHAGVDIPVPTGTPIAAAGDGVVTSAGGSGGYGLAVRVAHPDGTTTVYAHASQVLVTAGQTVRAGESVALAGSTGLSTGPHLHFEVRTSSAGPQDPLDWFSPSG